MGTAAFARLGKELGAPAPEGFDRAAPADLDFLAEALREERARRSAGLGDAAEEALKLVPALARGPVRRILFR